MEILEEVPGNCRGLMELLAAVVVGRDTIGQRRGGQNAQRTTLKPFFGVL